MPFIWLPLIAVNVASYFYMYDKYRSDVYSGDYIVSHRVYLFHYKLWEGDNWRLNGGVRDKFGNKALNEEYYRGLQIEGDYVTFGYVGGLYSLSERRFIIPVGQTLKTYGTIEEAENGREGIVSLEGDILVPFIYRDIRFVGDYDGAIAEGMDSKSVILDAAGKKYKTYDGYIGTETSCTDEKYYIFKDNIDNKSKYYFVKLHRNDINIAFTSKIYTSYIIDDGSPILFISIFNGVVDTDGDYILELDEDINYDIDNKQFYYRNLEREYGNYGDYEYIYYYYSRNGKFVEKRKSRK